MGKHTPGPWLLSGRTVYALNEQGFNRFSALVQDAHAPAYELNANSRLIAAAPELLEACEALITYDDFIEEDDGKLMMHYADLVRMTRAAVAKAKGEQQ